MPGSTSETIAIGPTNSTTGGVNKTLAKIDGSKPYASEYFFSESDGSQNYRLSVSNTFKSGDNLRNYVNFTRVTPATLTTVAKTEAVSVSINGPITSNQGLREMLLGICAWLTTANIDKLRGGQS